MGSNRSAPLVMFLKCFLDMFQNRFSIVFRHRGRFAAPIDRLRSSMFAISRKRGSKFGFDAIPIPITHGRPPRIILCGAEYGSPVA